MKKETIIERLKGIVNWFLRNGFPGYKTAVSVLREAIKLIQRQEEVLRCKDCRDYLTPYCPCDVLHKDENWFCGDGRRKEGKKDA